jgi:hypothetical protein
MNAANQEHAPGSVSKLNHFDRPPFD